MMLILFFIVAFDLSALVRYITRFTEESFAVLISLIFIFEVSCPGSIGHVTGEVVIRPEDGVVRSYTLPGIVLHIYMSIKDQYIILVYEICMYNFIYY